MSKKVTIWIAGVAASLAFMVGGMQGCGSSGSGGSNYQSLCNQGCDRVGACSADAGVTFDVASCKTGCMTQAQSHCTNEAAIASKIQECLNTADCTAAGVCANSIPGCVVGGTGGTGGTTGTAGGGGSTGTGGGGGTSGGAWTCSDQPGQACSCIPGPGGTLTSCPSSYNCCTRYNAGGTDACSCATLTAAQCTQLVSSLMGTQVGSCPP